MSNTMRTPRPYTPRDTSKMVPPKASLIDADWLGDRWRVTFMVEDRTFTVVWGWVREDLAEILYVLRHLGTKYLVVVRGESVLLYGRDEMHRAGVQWPDPDEGSTWLRTECVNANT